MNRIASNIIKSLLVASVFSISGNDVEDTNDYMYTVGTVSYTHLTLPTN